ncbi:hypothetical protein K435DRAFT_812681 [Dendrothele bispora CBS 962.96]|uniref:Uncharacterized protein n=1 Tax=Dendrothele bispora (strain CBS 962.96) TaxID=1314807 RepID=A0A4S8KNI0_DENBC|nr:hypothetical protein K435DRAFT_812681 [Dendrothele bispora CBS 962.96]
MPSLPDNVIVQLYIQSMFYALLYGTLGFVSSSIGTISLLKFEAALYISPGFGVILSITRSQATLFGAYTIANIIADIVLIHRCYRVWGAKKKIIAFPVIISTINNGLALVRLVTMAIESSGSLVARGRMDFLSQNVFKSFLAVNFFTNLFIPLMIVLVILVTFLQPGVSGGLDTKSQIILHQNNRELQDTVWQYVLSPELSILWLFYLP